MLSSHVRNSRGRLFELGMISLAASELAFATISNLALKWNFVLIGRAMGMSRETITKREKVSTKVPFSFHATLEKCCHPRLATGYVRSYIVQNLVDTVDILASPFFFLSPHRVGAM